MGKGYRGEEVGEGESVEGVLAVEDICFGRTIHGGREVDLLPGDWDPGQ